MGLKKDKSDRLGWRMIKLLILIFQELVSSSYNRESVCYGVDSSGEHWLEIKWINF